MTSMLPMPPPPPASTSTSSSFDDDDAFYSSTRRLLPLPTPSSLDGVPAHVEARLRAYGCGLIVRAVAALQGGGGGGGGGGGDENDRERRKKSNVVAIPAAAAATAQALLHRYYCRHSLARPASGDVRRVAAALTWLALKLEEGWHDAEGGAATRRLLLVFARLEARDDAAAASVKKDDGGGDAPPPPPPPFSPELLLAHSRAYEQRRASLVRIERLALDALGFSCAVEHPHKLLLGLSHALSVPPPPTTTTSTTATSENEKDPRSSRRPSLAEEAWALCNDSLRTPLCVAFGPEAVAAGCFFLASRRLRVPLPEGGAEGAEEEEGKTTAVGPWWRLLGVPTAEVFEVARVVAALLEAEPPRYEDAGAWLREKEKREAGARRGGAAAASTATTEGGGGRGGRGGGGHTIAAAAPPSSALPLSARGSAAASAVAKARAAAARAAAAAAAAAAARKKQRR